MKSNRPAAGDAQSESVAVLLTAPQPAAIAVVRLDGPATKAFAAQHLSKQPVLNRCVYCDLCDDAETIDDVVAVLIGDDRIDLNLHGGTWVIEAALRLAARAGFHVVLRHESVHQSTDTADEIEAEVAAALPYAATREALAILLAQPAAWRQMLKNNDDQFFRLALSDRVISHIFQPPTIAIVGEPNAGKSTLVNRLAGQARSITADVPGTTRDYVTAPANLGGLIVNLIDTPGVRATDDTIEAEAISRAAQIISTAHVVIELRDATQSKPAHNLHSRTDVIIVWNKCDLAPRDASGSLSIAAATGEGVGELVDRILATLGADHLQSLHARCWTDRQRNLIGLSPSGRG